MPRLVDTTIRLLSQEPLAGEGPDRASCSRLAEVLDKAGFACLEVSGGGVFDTAVRRGVESPWERIRALKARTTTPLGLALRGRFLVGSRPGRRRLRAPLRRLGGRERDRRLPPARPAERRLEPARRRRGDRRRRARSSTPGSSTARATAGATDALVEQAQRAARPRSDARAGPRSDAAASSRTRPRELVGARRARRRGCRSASTARARAAAASPTRSRRHAPEPT